jgi:hypothetical protein
VKALAMGTCEPGQVRNQAAISNRSHVPGLSQKAAF